MVQFYRQCREKRRGKRRGKFQKLQKEGTLKRIGRVKAGYT